MFNRAVHFIFSLLVVVSLVSCGGGGSAGSEGGIGGTGVSGGRVTGFGSVIVNGVHFDTTGAVVTKDDGAAETNSDDANINTLLSEGMVVTIEGKINNDGLTGKADKITYQDKLEGPVVGTPADGSFVALGQTVIVSNLTRYSGGLNTFADISDKQVVEVSGFYDTNGNIIATFIEKKANDYAINTIFEIKGIATVVGGTLTIGALTIDTTIDTTGFNNQFVEVYGTFNGIDTLTANSIEIKTQGFTVGDKQYAELEGIAISGCTVVPCDFTLNGVTVRVNSSTQFKAGLVSDINAGVFVEAEGSLQGNILIAHEIDFKDNIEIQGDVQSKGTDTVVVDFGATDLTVKVDMNLTRIKGCSAEENFSGITGNITIRARKTLTEVVATRVECGGTVGEVYIQAQVENSAYDMLTLLGLDVDTSTATKFEDSNSLPIDRTIFYNSVKNGNLVEVVGTVNGGTVNWAEVKLDL